MSTSPLSLVPRVRFWHVLAMLVAANAVLFVAVPKAGAVVTVTPAGSGTGISSTQRRMAVRAHGQTSTRLRSLTARTATLRPEPTSRCFSERRQALNSTRAG